ncbi:thiopurine S-methyltransferase L homeolog isoform X1 [Xenopus laevis]|nr:thiopurine S-methyltransferase L homeolog isoform X1 [Xenopus laevis]
MARSGVAHLSKTEAFACAQLNVFHLYSLPAVHRAKETEKSPQRTRTWGILRPDVLQLRLLSSQCTGQPGESTTRTYYNPQTDSLSACATLLLLLPRSDRRQVSIGAFRRITKVKAAIFIQGKAMDTSSGSTQLKTGSEVIQNRVLSEKDWKDKWEAKNIGFHESNVHEFLSEFVEEMVNTRAQIRIFFPLCGKAVDMKWLADMGHSIVGVDVSEKGLKEFFDEQNIPYVEETVPEIPGAKVFKSSTGNISLYCCNMFDLSSSIIGKFGGIWDRGAMVAINPRDRERYTKLILTLMENDCRYLLVTVVYDPKLVQGPPFYISDTVRESLLGQSCNVKFLKSINTFTDRQKGWGLDYYNDNLYLVTLKSSS